MTLPPMHSMAYRPRAFTMIEVLIAMGIFAVGFVAVAAIFPTAILLQKKTVEDVVAQQVARNCQALLEARGLKLGLGTNTDGDLWDQMRGAGHATWETDQRVYPLPLPMLTASHDYTSPTPTPQARWLLQDRSYPSSTTPIEARKVFWVPMIRDSKNPAGITADDVTVYVFILQRATDGTYPRPDLTPTNWANFYDGFIDTAPVGTPDAGDAWSVPAVTKLAVTVDTADLQRFNLGTGNNVWTSGGMNYLKINVGDQILDCFGTVYTVADADNNGVKITGLINANLDTGNYPDEIWFAHSDTHGKQRPARRILTLTKVVKP